MSASFVSAAGILVRAWTWIYTLPLDTRTRCARRQEIASDLWEFRTEHIQSSPIGAAVHTLIRLCIGVPDDVQWTWEQLPDHVNPPRLSTVVRIVPIVVAMSTLVLSANAPTLDPARVMRVNVVGTGWLQVASTMDVNEFVPAFAFTVTNVGDRTTSAIQVNALFHHPRGTRGGYGSAFSPVVGWRGLTPGTTSDLVRIRGRSPYGLDEVVTRYALPLPNLDQSSVTLFAQHQGRWSRLGVFPVPGQRIRP